MRPYTGRMNDEYRQALGKVLAEKRGHARLHKNKLALMVGVNRATIRYIERGKENLTIDTLLRIAQGLGVSLADVMVETERLLYGENKERPPIPDSIQLDTSEPAGTYFITRL